MPSRGQLSRTNNDNGVGKGNLNAQQAPASKRGKNCQPVRLYVKGCFYSFHRGFRNSYENQSLIKIQGVNDADAAEFYLGKKVAYIWKASVLKNGTRYRVKWGKVTRSHGSNGAVRVRFSTPLPAKALGSQVRVMLYPSRV